ncbi:MAG: hypothetical protein ACK49J_08420 [Verrucomicrobiota bacterium]
MSTLLHPTTLNPLQRYRQARSVLTNTTRASNPAWYQDALSLDLQLHIRHDGENITAFFHKRSNAEWSKGPEIKDATLRDPETIRSFATNVISHSRSLGASSLGVILHIADEFATSELKPELDSPASLEELRATAYTKPSAILEDNSAMMTEHSWRVIPYPAQGSGVIGTTASISRQYDAFLSTLRETGENENFPVITHALSAPLVSLMALPRLVDLTPGKPFVAALHYPCFTALFFFNEHADLLLMRSLQHRHSHRSLNLRNALSTTDASLELIDPDMHVIELDPNPTTSMHEELSNAFPTSKVSTVTITGENDMPAWCIEPRIAVSQTPGEQGANSLTFSILSSEKWALQDFLPTPVETAELYPNRSEMKLIRNLAHARLGLFAAAALIIVWLSFGIVEIVRHEEWAFDGQQTNLIKTRLEKLDAERKKIEHWDNLLEDRSKAWVTMELLSSLFPERCGVIVKGFTHTIRPEVSPAKARIGLIKEWKITGLHRDEAIDRLNTINTQEGIIKHFTEISRATGNPAFNPIGGNRSIAVNVRTQENNRYKPAINEEIIDTDDSSYPYAFDLTITQRFEASDPISISASKLP